MKKKKLIDTKNKRLRNIDAEKNVISFTARLIAYYRAQESKSDSPLIIDPFAELLAGDMTSYFDKHRHFSQNDYAIVRAYYIEENLLRPWCNTQAKSQIVLLGAGLDTRAYRFKPLQKGSHTIFEIDFPIMNQYKEEILESEQPLCSLIRISADISKQDWASKLIKSEFSYEIPTFWVLEGLVYYLEQEVVVCLLKEIAQMCTEKSQIFADICVPILAELNFGPFAKYFKWGLNKIDVSSFFSKAGWNVSCSFADDFDQGRDVGQRGLIFVHGERANTK